MTLVISERKDAARRAAATAKAGTLIEALPWLDEFHGATVVIKYGGHAMTADELRAGFAKDLVFLKHAGLRPVVVHGGGPQVTSHLDRLGIESVFTAGLRVTTEETIDVVRMVLNGKVNKDIVGLINRYGPYAVGLSGEDANLFTAERKLAKVDGELVDIGLVGEIVSVDPSMVEALLDDGRIPVVSSIGRGADGAVYNVNADTAAAALAVALGAGKLVVLTDVEGLYLDWPNSDEVISQLDTDDLERLLPSLSAGMIPKMEACLTAVRGGVPHAHVLDGRLSHAILLEIFTDSGIGTMVVSAPQERGTRWRDDCIDALRERFEAAMMPNYGTPPLALARGAGSRVWDADGNRYLDLIAGIAVSALGHAHPSIVAAVTGQVGKIAHTSNLFVHEPGVLLAEKLQGLLHDDARVFFCNSGTEANEAALKVVRRTQGRERPVIVAADHSFHGRTMGALAITGKESIRAPFAPFGFDVRWVEYGDAAALANAVDDRVAAVFLEPTQGEGGVIPAPPGYLAAARQACDTAGAMFVLDEIQSGIGRTGAWFAHQAEGVTPDVMTLAKGLGGGLPIGACVGFGAAGTALVAGDHGSTFGGNPVACAAALAVLDTIEHDDLLKNVKTVGETLASGITAIDHPLLRGVRGTGLWLAAVLTEPKAPAVTTAARAAGFLVNAVQPDAVRLAPPLILTQAEASEFVAALPAILARADEQEA